MDERGWGAAGMRGVPGMDSHAPGRHACAPPGLPFYFLPEES